MYRTLTRKQIRAIEKKNKKSAVTLRKGTSILGTAMLVSSLSTPFLGHVAAAEERLPDDQVNGKQQTEGEHLQGEYHLQSETTESTESIESEKQETTQESSGSSEQSTVIEESTEESTEASSTPTDTPETEKEEIIYGSDNGKEFVDNPQAYMSIDGESRIMARSYSSPNQQDFINQISSYAKEIAPANDLYVSVMIAQAILESGWGSSSLSKAPNYNLFGIKGSYNGNSVTMQTKEYLNGKWVTIYDQFRKYPSFRESLADNARVLKTTSFSPGVYFYSGVWKSNTKSYRDATSWLAGRYATDPTYNAKLNNIIETYNLTQHDTPNNNGGNNGSNQPGGNSGNNQPGSNTGGGEQTPPPVTPPTTNPPVNGETYTVVSGDTLYAIGQRYGVSVTQLKSWNQLTSDTIYSGQKLIVKATGNSSGGGSTGETPSKPNNGGNNQNQGNNTLYTVVSGDSLYAIGQRYGVSVAQLKSWNQLSSDTIYPGQKLIVKSAGNTGNGGSNNQSTAKPSTPNGSNQQQTTYTVASGDSLYAIGMRYGVSVAQLKSWNKLSSDIIFPGQKLIVQSGSSTAPTGPTSSGKPNAAAQYTVKSGDTLYAISLKHNVSVSQLMQWNNLSSPLIFVGQKLVVSSGSSQTPVVPSASSNQKMHIVKSGDTLWGIAQQYHTTVSQLKQKNNLQTDIIYIGQRIAVG